MRDHVSIRQDVLQIPDRKNVRNRCQSHTKARKCFGSAETVNEQELSHNW